tara:strand:- start:9335 stop:10489 length:1155 start_codon:yes stop_codon:yes gene_type:complete
MTRLYIFSKKQCISFFVIFFVFDLFFLPSFLASTPLSFFLLVFLSPLFFLIKKEYLLVYMLLLAFMLASIINGISTFGMGTEENIKRFTQISLILSIIFINFKILDYPLVEKMLNKLIVVFLVYLIVLLIVSVSLPQLYLSYMAYLSPNSINMIISNVEVFRFSYIFSDPNTLGYLLVFTAIYSLFYFKNTKFAIIIWLIIFFLILTTQSRGALLALVFTAMMVAIWQSRFTLSTLKIIFFSIGLLLIIVFIFQDFFAVIIDAFEKRSEIEDAMGTGMGGGRDKKYVYFINNVNFSLYGVGYSLFIDGIEFRPHSDLIRMGLSYGVFFVLFFFMIFFPYNFKSSSMLLSFMFPFLINTVIDEYRLFGLFVILFMFMKHDKRLLF